MGMMNDDGLKLEVSSSSQETWLERLFVQIPHEASAC